MVNRKFEVPYSIPVLVKNGDSLFYPFSRETRLQGFYPSSFNIPCSIFDILFLLLALNQFLCFG